MSCVLSCVPPSNLQFEAELLTEEIPVESTSHPPLLLPCFYSRGFHVFAFSQAIFSRNDHLLVPIQPRANFGLSAVIQSRINFHAVSGCVAYHPDKFSQSLNHQGRVR